MHLFCNGIIASFSGQFLTEAVSKHESLELAFVWNRSKDVLKDLDQNLVLDDLADCASKHPDLIVEVSHPDIVKQVSMICNFLLIKYNNKLMFSTQKEALSYDQFNMTNYVL